MMYAFACMESSTPWLTLMDRSILLILAYRSVKRHFDRTCFITPLKTLSFSYSLRIIGLEPTNSAWKADVITISPNSLTISFLFSLLFMVSISSFFDPYRTDVRKTHSFFFFSFSILLLLNHVFSYNTTHPLFSSLESILIFHSFL